MKKNPVKLVYMPGCEGCGKICKYNGPIADPVAASNYDGENAYACNSRLEGFTVEVQKEN